MAAKKETGVGIEGPAPALESVISLERSDTTESNQAFQLQWITRRLKVSVERARLLAEILFGGRAT